MTPRSSLDERDAIYRRTVAPLAEVMERLTRAIARGDTLAHDHAVAEMGRYIGQVLALCNLLGRRRALLLTRAASKRAHFDAVISPFVPPTVFEEAVSDILEREPTLAIGWEAVVEVYSQEHGFALAKSADLKITERVQRAVEVGIRTGDSRAATRVVAEVGDWTDAYADTVFRTNSATAYTAGTFQQAADPDIAEVMKALEFLATLDSDCRANHRAAHGLIAPANDFIWDVYAPPLGYRCRCDVRMVSKYELETLGLYDLSTGAVQRRIPSTFSEAHPDPGFRTGNPARRIAFG